MKERPILFSGAMVRAILEGRKTQTRRPIDWKRLHKQAGLDFPTPCKLARFAVLGGWGLDAHDGILREVKPPFGDVGDRLWVKEAWYCWSTPKHSQYHQVFYKNEGEYQFIETDVDGNRERVLDSSAVEVIDHYHPIAPIWRPSIHMPRWASRLTLEITGVRVERLRAITAEDAQHEGIIDDGRVHCGCGEPWCNDPAPDARDSFIHLWDSIYGPRHLGWDVNPWVWVVEFKTIIRPEPRP